MGATRSKFRGNRIRVPLTYAADRMDGAATGSWWVGEDEPLPPPPAYMDIDTATGLPMTELERLSLAAHGVYERDQRDAANKMMLLVMAQNEARARAEMGTGGAFYVQRGITFPDLTGTTTSNTFNSLGTGVMNMGTSAASYDLHRNVILYQTGELDLMQGAKPKAKSSSGDSNLAWLDRRVNEMRVRL